MGGLIKISLQSRPENVRLLGATVKGICSCAQCPPEDSGLIQTAIVEALNNVIRHAYQGEPDKTVDVEFQMEPGLLKATIQDEGLGLEAWPNPRLDFDPQDVSSLPEGGMGIFIINQVMDQGEYTRENGRNVLVMTKSLVKA